MSQDQITFKDFIFKEFVEWEKQQPNKRSSFSAFARWLTDNRYKVEFKQQLISDWVKGRYAPKEEMYILVLAEKLGNQVYEILDVPPINPLRIYALRNWEKAPKKIQQELTKIIAKYSKEPIPDEIREKQPSKPR